MTTNGLPIDNPFAVQTPEDITATRIVSLFVDVFADFFQILSPGHTFLNGPRGSGKSMMFRYLEPDCQVLAKHCNLRELPFFGVYVAIKNTELKLTEFSRLTDKHAEIALSEHFLVTFIAVKCFSSLLKAGIDDVDGTSALAFRNFYEGHFSERLKWSGCSEVPPLSPNATLEEMLLGARDLFSSYYVTASTYLKKLALSAEILPYEGPLLGYLDFLLPVLKELKEFAFMPDGPIYLLIDDADNLNLVQTQILNGWVSSRTSATVSLKISTQLSYKTYLTATRQLIAAPHDFNEIHISAVYTSQKDRYRLRVAQIVERRLEQDGIYKSVHEFFPPYAKQETEVTEIASKLIADWEATGRGNRARDDAARYARPNYIRSLQGMSKSGSTYRYAGFDQLVHLSSGIVRYFLEAASAMFGHMLSRNDGQLIEFIEPAIQDKIARDEANRFFFGDFEQIETAEGGSGDRVVLLKYLRNLIRALGGMFHAILISDAAERRVFSIALTDERDDEVLKVLKMGVQYGYFHESSIGNKEGTGRVRLFIMSRRLAPVFTLDPSSFAGYKFITTAALRLAMTAPKTFLNRFESGQPEALLENGQFSLFETIEVDHV